MREEEDGRRNDGKKAWREKRREEGEGGASKCSESNEKGEESGAWKLFGWFNEEADRV